MRTPRVLRVAHWRCDVANTRLVRQNLRLHVPETSYDFLLSIALTVGYVVSQLSLK